MGKEKDKNINQSSQELYARKPQKAEPKTSEDYSMRLCGSLIFGILFFHTLFLIEALLCYIYCFSFSILDGFLHLFSGGRLDYVLGMKVLEGFQKLNSCFDGQRISEGKCTRCENILVWGCLILPLFCVLDFALMLLGMYMCISLVGPALILGLWELPLILITYVFQGNYVAGTSFQLLLKQFAATAEFFALKAVAGLEEATQPCKECEK